MLDHVLVPSSSSRKGRGALFLPLSVALHLALIAVAIFAATWRVEMPGQPPNQWAQYQLQGTAPLPPPAPAGPPRVEPAAPRQPVSPPDDAAPVIVPDTIPDVEPASGSGSEGEPGTGEPGGDPNGIPGGVPGGVPGGTPGSLVTGPADPGPIYVRGDVRPPVNLSRVNPDYPELARRLGVQGVVVLECVIDREGRVTGARVIKPVHPLLDKAAMNAVEQWRFRPATLNGQAVEVYFNLTVNFAIRR